jgi:hypothetical protein
MAVAKISLKIVRSFFSSAHVVQPIAHKSIETEFILSALQYQAGDFDRGEHAILD